MKDVNVTYTEVITINGTNVQAIVNGQKVNQSEAKKLAKAAEDKAKAFVKRLKKIAKNIMKQEFNIFNYFMEDHRAKKSEHLKDLVSRIANDLPSKSQIKAFIHDHPGIVKNLKDQLHAYLKDVSDVHNAPRAPQTAAGQIRGFIQDHPEEVKSFLGKMGKLIEDHPADVKHFISGVRDRLAMNEVDDSPKAKSLQSRLLRLVNDHPDEVKDFVRTLGRFVSDHPEETKTFIRGVHQRFMANIPMK